MPDPLPLPLPSPSRPILYGAPAPEGELLPWSWADDRLRQACNYWVVSVRPSGRPHSRPVWGVWLDDGFWFVTASLAQANILTNPAVSMHLEDGTSSVIIEGRIERAAAAADVQRLADAYKPVGIGSAEHRVRGLPAELGSEGWGGARHGNESLICILSRDTLSHPGRSAVRFRCGTRNGRAG